MPEYTVRIKENMDGGFFSHDYYRYTWHVHKDGWYHSVEEQGKSDFLFFAKASAKSAIRKLNKKDKRKEKHGELEFTFDKGRLKPVKPDPHPEWDEDDPRRGLKVK